MCSMKLSVGEYIKFLHETYIPSVDKAQIFKVVCGNQSADLDSVVSAISYSYFSYRVNTQDVLIPIINIPRNQLKIRKDILYLLNQVSISPDSLFFIEELQNFAEKFGKVKAVLVDHNDPQGGARNIVDVVGIIDHHVDLGLHKDLDNGSGPRIIETTGSCSSLVLQYWRKSLQEDELCAMKEPLRMCWSALALDTSLMHNKVKEADIEANKIYSKCLSGLNFEQEYQTLLTARNDLSGLTGLQVLEKDFKDFSSLTTRREEIRVGSSSVPGKSLGWFKEQNIDIVGACYELNSQLQLDYEVVLSHWREADVPRRQLLFVTKEENLDQLWDIVNFIKDELRLVEDCPFSNYPGVLAFEQLNVNASRKQVIPLLQSAINKL